MRKLLFLAACTSTLQSMQQSFQALSLCKKDQEISSSRHFKNELTLDGTVASTIWYDINYNFTGPNHSNFSKEGYLRKLTVHSDYRDKALEKLSVIYAIQSIVRKVDNPACDLRVMVGWLYEPIPKLNQSFFQNLGFVNDCFQVNSFNMSRLEKIQTSIESKLEEEE